MTAATARPREAAGSPSTRSVFLDAVRAIALVRVVCWHAVGASWVSWVVATMPAMFFVAGHLLARSLDQRPVLAVWRSRFRRLLVPFWVFGGVMWVGFALLHLSGPTDATAPLVGRLLAWIVPLFDPRGPAAEGGWVSSPLWYLRAYLWLLLLGPVLRLLTRRLGSWSLLAPLAGTMVWEVVRRVAGDALPAEPAWLVGDVLLYSFFLMLGFLAADGLLDRLSSRELWEWVAISVAATALWWMLLPAPTGVVNHSAPALLLWGIGWLATFLALRGPITSIASTGRPRAVVHWFTRRAVTVYLWHSPAILASYWLADRLAPGAPSAVVLAPTAVLVVGAVLVAGWAEDVAARRPAELWPRPGGGVRFPALRVPSGSAGLAGAAVVSLVVAASVVPVTRAGGGPAGEGLALPPAPSGRPETAVFDTEPVSSPMAPGTPTAVATDAVEGDLDERLRAVADGWRERHDVQGVRLGVMLPDDRRVALASGSAPDGSALGVGDVVPVTSITKTMTAAVVLSLAEDGLIELDAPIPRLEVLPDSSVAGRITPRQLLQHTAGIAPYQEVAGYQPGSALDPLGALRLATAAPLQWEPGSVAGYSNSGYLLLGVLAEEASGRAFEELLATEVLEPAGLDATRLDDSPTAGWVGWAAGGAVSNVDDLLSWGDALYRDGRILGPSSLAEMLSVENPFAVGLGANPVCPCSTSPDGSRTVTSIGHDGGAATLQWSPGDDLVIAVSLTESMWTDQLRTSDVHELLAAIRAEVTSLLPTDSYSDAGG